MPIPPAPPPGNHRALRHGATSPAIVAANTPPVVAELQEALTGHLSYLEPPELILVEQLARLIVRIRLIDNWYDRLGGSMVDARGRPRGSWQLYMALLREFRATAASLGIGPAARAQLVGDLASRQRREQAEEAQAALQARYGSGGQP